MKFMIARLCLSALKSFKSFSSAWRVRKKSRLVKNVNLIFFLPFALFHMCGGRFLSINFAGEKIVLSSACTFAYTASTWNFFKCPKENKQLLCSLILLWCGIKRVPFSAGHCVLFVYSSLSLFFCVYVRKTHYKVLIDANVLKYCTSVVFDYTRSCERQVTRSQIH